VGPLYGLSAADPILFGPYEKCCRTIGQLETLLERKCPWKDIILLFKIRITVLKQNSETIRHRVLILRLEFQNITEIYSISKKNNFIDR
jgi:hypothetical protein